MPGAQDDLDSQIVSEPDGDSAAGEATPSIPAPEWFRLALVAPVTVSTVEVDGCQIAYRHWGDPRHQAVVLVHGGGAHSRWWDHVAPLLTDGRSVYALDLSGHGDSGRRPDYSFSQWAREILTVAALSMSEGPAVVVAHSMGGWAAIEAAAIAGDDLKGIVVVDTPIRERSPEEDEARSQSAFGPLRLYTTAEEAMSRFHPVPDQPNLLPYVIDHVARTSMRQVPGGWMWKFDPNFVLRQGQPDSGALGRIRSRFALLRAEFGLVTPEIDIFLRLRLPDDAVVVEIPQAYHHVMLDQPLSLVTAVRALLAGWHHGGWMPLTEPGMEMSG